jgi:hypothetical protein
MDMTDNSLLCGQSGAPQLQFLAFMPSVVLQLISLIWRRILAMVGVTHDFSASIHLTSLEGVAS